MTLVALYPLSQFWSITTLCPLQELSATPISFVLSQFIYLLQEFKALKDLTAPSSLTDTQAVPLYLYVLFPSSISIHKSQVVTPIVGAEF